MAASFTPAPTRSPIMIFGAVFGVAGLLAVGWVFVRSEWATVWARPSSSQFHSAISITSRRSVSIAATATRRSRPPPQLASRQPIPVCPATHRFGNSPVLQTVRDSLANNTPIEWNRVDTLPDYVYFNHSIHVDKGVACVTCHGQVDQMPLTWKTQTLQME